MSSPSSTRDVLAIARDQGRWRKERTINLIPSENVTSPQVRALLASDFGHRYSLQVNAEIHGTFMENAYRGTRYLDEVEALGTGLARELFNASYATLKPLSGHISALVTLIATCKPGDRYLAISPEDGGYDGYGPEYLPRLLGLDVEFLPFDSEHWNVHVDAASEMIEDSTPRLVVLGASLFTFPYELSPLRRACDSAGALLAYDASHVMGLIAGGEFQRPLDEGVDIVLGSTHKSLFGPQGGLIVAKEGLATRLDESLTWKAVDNAHWNRIAALAQALLETKEFGKAYAHAVGRNAKTLARELDERGVPVKFRNEGYTRSPMLLLDGTRVQEEFGVTLNDLAIALEANDIITDAVGRIGTNEITRMGAGESTMADVADCILHCAQGEDVREEVARIRGTLGLSYYFEDR